MTEVVFDVERDGPWWVAAARGVPGLVVQARNLRTLQEVEAPETARAWHADDAVEVVFVLPDLLAHVRERIDQLRERAEAADRAYHRALREALTDDLSELTDADAAATVRVSRQRVGQLRNA